MNLTPFLKKYGGIIITKPECVRPVSDILHLDPDICYMSGADVHEYDDININHFIRYPDNPVAIAFNWYNNNESVRLTCGSYFNDEEQPYIKDIELIEQFSKSIIILNNKKF